MRPQKRNKQVKRQSERFKCALFWWRPKPKKHKTPRKRRAAKKPRSRGLRGVFKTHEDSFMRRDDQLRYNKDLYAMGIKTPGLTRNLDRDHW